VLREIHPPTAKWAGGFIYSNRKSRGNLHFYIKKEVGYALMNWGLKKGDSKNIGLR